MKAGKFDRWSPEEIEFLRREYKRIGCKRVAAHLGRTVRAVQRKATTMGVTTKEHPWTPEEEASLVVAWPKYGAACCCQFPLRTRSAVAQRAKRLGVRYQREILELPKFSSVEIPRVNSVFALAKETA